MKLYEEVLVKSQNWGTPDNLMYVVGATQAEKTQSIRALAPEHFFLVPGIGAQGGDLETVSRTGMNKHCGLLANSTRSIIYASSGTDFAKSAAQESKKLQTEMERFLGLYL
jgi:orotidine-5'-phosphate decarboxylase